MRSFALVVSVLLLVVSQVGGFGGCGCRHRPPPCEAQKAPSCGEQQGCPPCESDNIPEPCPECPAPGPPQCPACPAPKRPPPCQVCKAPKKCEVCHECPPPVEPEPCPTCPPPPPPVDCPVCPAPEPESEPECPPPRPQPSHPKPCGGAPRARPQPQQPHLGNDCCNQCNDGCFVRRRLRMHGAATLVVDIDPTCNNEKLRSIILNNILETTSESKRAIQKEANDKLFAQFDVVCAKGEFAYVISSNQFCQETKNDITCYAFRRN
uniref:Ground-like domain-containing protein n=1 Tax=Plectus sambesii TaxID=2011161 RepID=A0A914WP52_9BILA